MNLSSVVVAANSRGRVELHKVIAHIVVVCIAVGAVVPNVAVVVHIVEVVVAVRNVLLTVQSRVVLAVPLVWAGAASAHWS